MWSSLFRTRIEGWPSLVLSSNNLNECILAVLLLISPRCVPRFINPDSNKGNTFFQEDTVTNVAI